MGAPDAREAIASDAESLTGNVRGVLWQQEKPPRRSDH